MGARSLWLQLSHHAVAPCGLTLATEHALILIVAQVKVGKTMDWVLGLDTFDQARKFNHTEIAAALQWASYLSSAMQAAQAALWEQEKDRTNAIIAVRGPESRERARGRGERRTERCRQGMGPVVVEQRSARLNLDF